MNTNITSRLTEFYYANVVGHYPCDTDTFRNITMATMQYLIDCGFLEKDICLMLLKSKPFEVLTPNDLPDSLWEDSLILRNVFYYHRELHIISPAPVFDLTTFQVKSSKFSLEMKIRYTMDDLLTYCYRQLHLVLTDRKRDAGAIEHLLKKYSQFSFIESIDFVLSLVDASKENQIATLFDISKNEVDVHEELKRKTAEAEAAKHNIIIWR